MGQEWCSPATSATQVDSSSKWYIKGIQVARWTLIHKNHNPIGGTSSMKADSIIRLGNGSIWNI
jgi:hypothetical protein